MSVTLTSIAHALRVQSKSTFTVVSLGHAQQLVAAALGYNTLAAYQASPDDSSLHRARHFILELPAFLDRAKQLGIQATAGQLTALLASAVRAQLPTARVHHSMAEFGDHLRERLDDVVRNDARVVNEMTMSNCDGISEIYLPFELSELPPTGGATEIEVLGHIWMDHDPERPYNGHIVDVEASVTIERTGRALLAELDIEVTGATLRYDAD